MQWSLLYFSSNYTNELVNYDRKFIDEKPDHNFVTTQKMKFSIKDFFSKCDQIRSKLENFIFCAVIVSLVNPFHAEAATGGVL